MTTTEKFVDHISSEYTTKGDYIYLGAGMLEEQVFASAPVKVPLKTMNRHGLIAGATGTGKSKTLQILAENLSQKGVPVLLMDVKGDLSGIAKASDGATFIDERHEKLGFPYNPAAAPVEMLSLSEQDGVRLRATVSEFGPVLLSRILDLNDTQSGIMAIIFKYCDDNHLPLLDLKDLKKMLQYTTEEGKEEISKEYGRISSASTGAILRKIVALEQQGAELFFGEKSFEVNDLLRKTSDGKGYVNILRLTDIQDRPKLFSTFMLSLLAEIYSSFPEKGDMDKPELVLFIDEAHLIFDEASDALLDQIESIVKLIRSKGVGLYFVTQNPADVPEEVLGQLGLKIQHALRAFTAKDRKAIKLAAENYPISEFYDTKNMLTSLGIGEAMVSALDEKGRPSPLVATMLRAPMSRMDILTDSELRQINKNSELVQKYNEEIDRESAYEILNKKIEEAEGEEARQQAKEQREKVTKTSSRRKSKSSREGAIIKVLTSATFIRGVMGILNKILK
ncbi:helicase HerA-like domain-containing protein [Christiangramia portivictoriae]|uniref:helicase HerA-like domain-containing protein n=1 Tax=Christiangramia portivictoriae TaxID=326069 RepID=UPI0004027D73|nr:helicase HerA-like domain-containing protein [Christiangramia portivictoriae]